MTCEDCSSLVRIVLIRIKSFYEVSLESPGRSKHSTAPLIPTFLIGEGLQLKELENGNLRIAVMALFT